MRAVFVGAGSLAVMVELNQALASLAGRSLDEATILAHSRNIEKPHQRRRA